MSSEAQAHNGKAQGSRAQHRRNTRSGQGIIEANRKTAICKHWLQGICPFGARCAFAHGAKELRNATTKPSPPPETGKAKHHQSPASRDATTPCSDPRCTAPPGAFSDGESWLLEAKSPVTDQGFLDADGHGRRSAWFETHGHSAATNNGCTRSPLQEIGTNNEPRAQAGDTFSLWQSPSTILQSPTPSSLDWAGSSAARNGGKTNHHHHHHNNNDDDDSNPATTTSAQPYLRGMLRENETWAKIAQRKPSQRRDNDYARAPNVTTTATTPSDFHRDEHGRSSVFRGTKAHVVVAGSAPCSSGVICCCRARSSREINITPGAFSRGASVDPEPALSASGLVFCPRGGSSPAPLNLGPPSPPPSQERTSTAAPAAAHRWNPITYNTSSAFGDSFPSSLKKGNEEEARKPSPSPAPTDHRYRHEMDDFLGRMMSVLSLDASRSNGDDASRDVGPSVPPSWYGPVLQLVEEKESAPSKTAQQPGGLSGDSSRLDQSYRNDSLGKSVAPDRNRKGTFTFSGDAFNVPSMGPILDEKWQTVLPTGGSLKDGFGFSEAGTTETETNRSASPSPFGWGLEPSSVAASTHVPNEFALTNPGERFSLW